MAEDPKKYRKDAATQWWFDNRYYRNPRAAEATTGTPRTGGIRPDMFVPSGGQQVALTPSTTFNFTPSLIQENEGEETTTAGTTPSLTPGQAFKLFHGFDPSASTATGGSGAQQAVGGSGRQEARGGSGKEKALGTQGDYEFSKYRLAPPLRPAVDALNYLLELNSINKIEKQQLGRKNMYLTEPSMSVRPIQDLSPEILAAQENAQSQVRSDYNGSDPVMNAIAKNMATATRGQMRTEHIAGRAAGLAAERSRWDTQMRENQKLAADTANKNLEKAQEFADYRLGAKNAAEEARKTLNASFLSQVGINIDTAAQFNLERQANANQIKRQALQDRIALAALYPEGQKATELDAIKQEMASTYTADELPYFHEAQRGYWPTRSQRTYIQNQNAAKIK